MGPKSKTKTKSKIPCDNFANRVSKNLHHWPHTRFGNFQMNTQHPSPSEAPKQTSPSEALTKQEKLKNKPKQPKASQDPPRGNDSQSKRGDEIIKRPAGETEKEESVGLFESPLLD